MNRKRKLYLKEWKKKNRDRINKYQRNYYQKNKDTWYKYKYKRKHNYSNYFKNASPISKVCIYRHGLNALRIYEKYNGKCAKCGQNWDLTIHHIDGNGRNKINKKEIPNNNLNNLILLCRKCHGSIHGKQQNSSLKHK